MLHRHLNHDGLTLTAIDNLIARGQRADWERLRLLEWERVLSHRPVREKPVRSTFVIYED